jgi:hypothetical protein
MQTKHPSFHAFLHPFFAAEYRAMKTSKLLALLIPAVLAGIAGCASTSSDESLRGSGAAPNNELITSNQLPGGSKINITQSMIMGSGNNWFGRMVLELPSSNDAYGFFLEQYPQQGWSLISSVRGKTSLLVFSKPDRSATIEMTDGAGLNSANAVLTISPKSTLPAQGTSSSAPRPMTQPVGQPQALPQTTPSTAPVQPQSQAAPRPLAPANSSSPAGARP